MLRELAKMIIAGANLDPSICHAYEGLLEVIIAEARSTQHGAGWRAMRPVRQNVAARLGQRVTHCRVPSMVVKNRQVEINRPEKMKAIIQS